MANRLVRSIEPFDAAPFSLAQAESLLQPALSIDTKDEARGSFQLALFARMLFSCLVDADFLATESFMNPEQAKYRPTARPQIDDVAVALHQHLARLSAGAANNEVGRCRQQVLIACCAAANQPPGLFTLTVPTGGGKTLASLAFALAHSQRHAMDRVIYAIPFTSIIEQTADVFRNVFAQIGDNIVLEHHSNVDPDDPKRETLLSRLAAKCGALYNAIGRNGWEHVGSEWRNSRRMCKSSYACCV